MKKIKRDLDGFYLRVKRGDKYESLCFTDLNKDEQEKWLARLSAEGLLQMVNTFTDNIKIMATLEMSEAELRIITLETANLLRSLGDRFGIVNKWAEGDEE